MKSIIAFDFQGVIENTAGNPVPSVIEYILKSMHHGHIVAIISKLPHHSLVQKIKNCHIPTEKIYIYGSDNTHTKAEAIKDLQRLNPSIPNNNIFFITDTLHDIDDVAIYSYVKIIACTWGYSPKKHLQTDPIHGIVCTPKDLLTYLPNA